MSLSVSVTIHPALRAVSVIARRHCYHSQCLISRSGWSLLIHPLPPRLSPDALLRRLDSLALFLRVPYIRTRTSPSHSRATFSLSRFLSLSLSSAASLVSGYLSRQRFSLALSLSLISPSFELSRRARRLASPLHRASLRRSSHFFSLAAEPPLDANFCNTFVFSLKLL